MKYKFGETLICVDEICSVAAVYVSSSMHSSIEKYETKVPYLAFYRSPSACAVFASTPHVLRVEGYIFTVGQLTPDITRSEDERKEDPTFKPMLIYDEVGRSVLYLPGCLDFSLFQTSLRRLGTQNAIFVEPRYLTKPQLTTAPNGALLYKMATYVRGKQVLLSYPLGFDVEFFLLRLCALLARSAAEAVQSTVPTVIRLNYVDQPKMLRKLFSLGLYLSVYANTPPAYFAALLYAHKEYIPAPHYRLVTVLPLFEPAQKQVIEEKDKMVVYYQAFMHADEIRKLAVYTNAEQVAAASAFGTEADIDGKQRRLARLKKGKTPFTAPCAVLNANDEELCFLRASGMM